MPFFGLNNGYIDDADSMDKDLEAALPSSSNSSTSEEREFHSSGLHFDTDFIRYRALRQTDRIKVQQLHEQWFPVSYSDEFYDELVTHHKLANSGDTLFTCVATVEETTSAYCQAAGETSKPQPQQQQQPQDEIIGCVVGAFLHPSRLNSETAEQLVPNPHIHSRLFYIMTLGTVEEYRGYGIATSLVEKCIALCEADPTGKTGALYLHVIPFNHAAIRFYEKLGFYRVCTIENYYTIDDKQYDCYLYAKYFHGNRGHRTLYTLVSGAISSIWQHLRSPLSIFSSSDS